MPRFVSLFSSSLDTLFRPLADEIIVRDSSKRFALTFSVTDGHRHDQSQARLLRHILDYSSSIPQFFSSTLRLFRRTHERTNDESSNSRSAFTRLHTPSSLPTLHLNRHYIVNTLFSLFSSFLSFIVDSTNSLVAPLPLAAFLLLCLLPLPPTTRLRMCLKSGVGCSSNVCLRFRRGEGEVCAWSMVPDGPRSSARTSSSSGTFLRKHFDG